MKNQNDLIFSIVAVVVFLIVLGCCWGMQPKPVQPTPPEEVNLAHPTVPTNTQPVLANALPGGSSSASAGRGGGMGGPMSFGGPGKGGPVMGGPPAGFTGDTSSGVIPANKKGFKGPQSMAGLGG